jgi:hypothetical protein
VAVGIVQVKGVAPGSRTTVPFVLDTAPAVGNILVAFVGCYGARTVTKAAGTWASVDTQTSSVDEQTLWWHQVTGGDGTSWTFTVSGGADYTSGVMYEVSGADLTTPVNAEDHTLLANTTNNTATTAAVTPSVLGCLALATWVMDTNTAVYSGVSGGWTEQFSGLSSGWRSILSASRDALTSDTTTAISTTWTITGGGAGNPGVTMILLVAPAAAATATAGLASGTGTAPAVAGMATSALVYAGSASGLAGGAGSWVNPGNATGTDDSTYATWAVP